MDIYQWNNIQFSKSTHTWAPIEDERLDKLIVEKNVPKILIMLSKDPFPESVFSERYFFYTSFYLKQTIGTF